MLHLITVLLLARVSTIRLPHSLCDVGHTPEEIYISLEKKQYYNATKQRRTHVRVYNVFKCKHAAKGYSPSGIKVVSFLLTTEIITVHWAFQTTIIKLYNIFLDLLMPMVKAFASSSGRIFISYLNCGNKTNNRDSKSKDLTWKWDKNDWKTIVQKSKKK